MGKKSKRKMGKKSKHRKKKFKRWDS